MGRGLERNAQVITTGGLGFRRGPLGGSLRPGVGHASDPIYVADSYWLIGLAIAGHV
ncbi:hypothetical protein Hanom_Chr05g00443381 [Helianthus anomalus]